MKKQFDPMSTELIPSGNPNLWYAPSSNGYDSYGVFFHSETKITCSCEGFEKYGLDCRHRHAARLRYQYVPELDGLVDEITLRRVRKAERDYWAGIASAVETEAEKDEVRALFEIDDLPPAA